ncbi:MAG: hypothetical protein VYA39_04885 [Candidatus Thermoplasmatota archaeon]|nr:hypothetical protein [Candidatus Thermoplasmatota archaeon]
MGAEEEPDTLQKDLEEMYRVQTVESITRESERRMLESNDPLENRRLLSLSLIRLVESGDDDLVPALMSRLGPVRSALEGHGGGLLVSDTAVETLNSGKLALSLVLDLDGACVSCGAAPGTLSGIQDDLMADEEIASIKFNSSMLDWFDEIQREFLLKHGGVTFV